MSVTFYSVFGGIMDKDARIYIAGHRGLVGSALMRTLRARGYHNLILRTSREMDLRRQTSVETLFAEQRPEYVFMAAARVGGILANNTCPAEFIYDNIAIQTNMIHAAYVYGIKKLLFLGSSCIYPRHAPQPMKEEYLLTGVLEPTNEPYAIAKIAGIKMCQAYNRQYGTHFLSVMPTNLYGPGDNFDLENSHVLPALLRKFHLAKCAFAGQWDEIEKDERRFGRIPDHIRAKLGGPGASSPPPEVVIWGTGAPCREFLHVDDLADACVFLMEEMSAADGRSLINIGWSKDTSIRDLAEILRETVGYQGPVVFDPTKPDGTPRKLLDTAKLEELGWKPKIALRDGIRSTYEWYCHSFEE